MIRYLSFLSCALVLFASARAEAQITALSIDSQPGDGIGNGLQHTYLEGELTFTAGSDSTPDRVVFWLYTPGTSSIQWSLEFWGGGSALAPRAYENAGSSSFRSPVRPGLHVTGLGFGCTPTGRFVVYEVEFDSLGRLAKFAADFEEHCNDRAAALFGAIRYKSSRSTLTPFDGVYPVYALHIDASPYGRVTAAGIDCGNGASDCDEQYGAVTDVSLTVTPAPGYAFLGWSTDCIGKLNPAALTVSQRRRCGAVFDALPDSGLPPPLTGGSALFVDREATAFRAADRWIWLPANAVFAVDGDASFIRATVTTWDGDRWTIEFAPPQGQALQPGTYNRARRYPFRSSMVPGFSLGGQAHACNALLARFVIYELSFNGTGKIDRFAADFEQHCESDVAAYTGSIRFNSTRAAVIPFDGVYPIHRLTIVPPMNGSVAGAGIECNGDGGPDCAESYAGADSVALVARPAPGYRFVGWTDDCSGSTNTTVLVVMTQQCGAVFDNVPGNAGSVPDDIRLGALALFSQRGDYIGQGQRHVSTRADSQVSVYTGFGTLSTRFASFLVTAPDGRTWTLAFSAPLGEILRPGDFNNASRYPFQSSTEPGLSISGYGRGCNQLGGRFRVYEAHFDITGKVDRFAADFEHHCEGLAPALFGAIRFNSTRSSLMPFDGAPLLPTIALNPPANASVVFGSFAIGGWALNTAETSGTGVDAVHVYAYPSTGGAPIFLGVATYGIARPDVGAIFGTPYTNSGFMLIGGGLPSGQYLIAALAHDTVTGNFDAVATASITVFAPRMMAVGPPSDGAHVTGSFLVAGWAIDADGPSGSGVDAIHAWAWPASGGPIFLGATTPDAMRPDVAALFGERFLVSGFNLIAPPLPPGRYVVAVYAHSAATGTFTQVRTLTITVD